MTAPMRAVPQRRGMCPGLSQPVPTGDGLLARLIPTGTIPLAAFAKLCAAARRHGDGVIEITSRGSIQVRGLSEASAPRFADEVAKLGIGAEDGVPIACNPLAGIDAEEIFDAASLAADLRSALKQTPLAARLNAKASVAINGGGQLTIVALPADVRLRAQTVSGDVAFYVSVGGDEAKAAGVGTVLLDNVVETARRLLEVIAQRGREARARSILATEGVEAFRAAVGDFLISGAPGCAMSRSREALATHRLRDGSLACGIGLAFGHADAASLGRLTDAAAAAGANGMRVAPGRVLVTIGIAPQATPEFLAAADRLGFVTCPDDPRRRVVACAGAPICASAHIASRAMAPRIADIVAAHRPDVGTIHISGCSKGCAHAGRAALTIVGTSSGCTLIADGGTRDPPFAVVPVRQLPDTVTHFLCQNAREAVHV